MALAAKYAETPPACVTDSPSSLPRCPPPRANGRPVLCNSSINLSAMHKRASLALLAVAGLVMVAVAALAGYRGYLEHAARPAFPTVDTAQLSPGRAAVVHVLAQEYAKGRWVKNQP